MNVVSINQIKCMGKENEGGRIHYKHVMFPLDVLVTTYSDGHTDVNCTDFNKKAKACGGKNRVPCSYYVEQEDSDVVDRDLIPDPKLLT